VRVLGKYLNYQLSLSKSFLGFLSLKLEKQLSCLEVVVL
jgi:hypothetical protein